MTQNTEENKMINRYLLGELSEDELAQVEEKYFADEDFFAQILDAENSLVDSYVSGNFSAIERSRFEERFLTTPQRRQKVKFAQSLNKAITEAQTNAATNVIALEKQRTIANQKDSWWQSLVGSFNFQGPALALGMGAVLLTFLGVWQMSEWRRGNRSSDIAKVVSPPEEQTSLGNNQQRATNDSRDIRLPKQTFLGNSEQSNIDENTQITKEAGNTVAAPQKSVNPQTGQQSGGQKPRSEKQGETVVRPEKQIDSENPRSEKSSPQARPVIATFMLLPGLARGQGGERTQVIIPPRADQIRLQLNLEEDLYPRYRAVLQNPDGTEVWNGRVPQTKKKGSKAITLLVLTKLLSKGDYRLILKGETAEGEIETINEYPFSIVKK